MGRALTLVRVAFVVSFGALITFNAGALNFQLVDSAPIDTGGHTLIACVGDMDGDGQLEAVLWSSWAAGDYRIVEREGNSWVHRQTIDEERLAVGDLDGDGAPELASCQPSRNTVRVYDATADDTYTMIYQQYVGYFIENIAIGDSNGNGYQEVLVARESSPPEMHAIEMVPPNTFTNLPSVTGYDRNCWTVGVGETTGNSIPEYIFHCYYESTRTTYVAEGGTVIASIPDFVISYVIDTDGDGVQELCGRIGYDPPSSDWRIYKYNGSGYSLFSSGQSQSKIPIDVDGDGRHEFRLVSAGGGGYNTLLTLYHLENGTTMSQIWNSGDMFNGDAANISSVLPIGDTDGDGKAEVAVLQGSILHIMEEAAPPLPDNVPAAGIGALAALVILVVLWSVISLRRRPPSE